MSHGNSSAVGGLATADAIVIGSGFGGAVAAARLAERGLRVLVLERGPWWGDERPGRPYPRGPLGMRRAVRNVRWSRGTRSRSFVLDRAGLLEVHLFERLLTVGASGIGGGSLVYADVQAEADERFWDHFPQEITAEEMRAPLRSRRGPILQPAPLPGTSARTAQFERAAAAAGFATDAAARACGRLGAAGLAPRRRERTREHVPARLRASRQADAGTHLHPKRDRPRRRRA